MRGWLLALLLVLTPLLADAGGVKKGLVLPNPPFPNAWGDGGAITQGAFALRDVDPVILVVTTTTDERDGCTGTWGNRNESCPVRCDTESGGANGVCSLREALLYPHPRVVVLNLPGPSCALRNERRIWVGKEHSYLTIDGSTSNCIPTLANYGLDAEENGFSELVWRNLEALPAGEWAKDDVDWCSGQQALCLSGDEGGSWDEDCCHKAVVTPLGARTDSYLRAIMDAVTLRYGVRNIVIDRSTFAWAADEVMDLGICRNHLGDAFDPEPGDVMRCSSNVTIQRSLIGPGLPGEDTGETAYPGGLELNHNYGFLMSSGGTPLNRASNKAQGILVTRNAFMMHDNRAPWQSGGSVRIEQNLYYEQRGSGLSLRGQQKDERQDIVDNLFLFKDDQLTWGYCTEGADTGRWCSADSAAQCAGDPDFCSYDRGVISNPLMIAGNTFGLPARYGSIYVAGNVAKHAVTGSVLDASGTPEFDAQWDFVRSGARPFRNPGGLGDPAGGGGLDQLTATNYWEARRSAPIQPVPLNMPPSVDVENDLEAIIRSEAGTVNLSPVAQEWWDIRDAGGGFADQGFLVGDQPRAYPVYTATVQWADTNENGMDDAWEAVNCPGGECDPLAVATVPRCEGYRWIQCWAHRDDFGEEVVQASVDLPACELPGELPCELAP